MKNKRAQCSSVLIYLFHFLFSLVITGSKFSVFVVFVYLFVWFCVVSHVVQSSVGHLVQFFFSFLVLVFLSFFLSFFQSLIFPLSFCCRDRSLDSRRLREEQDQFDDQARTLVAERYQKGEENDAVDIEPYFPVELAVRGASPLQFDFSRRLYDLPSKIERDLLTGELLPAESQVLTTVQEVDEMVDRFLDQFQPQGDGEADQGTVEADQFDKKELFLTSGK